MTIEIGQITIEKSAHAWLDDPVTQLHFGKKVKIIKATGWVLGDGVTMYTPITLQSFYARLAMCTLDGYENAGPKPSPLP